MKCLEFFLYFVPLYVMFYASSSKTDRQITIRRYQKINNLRVVFIWYTNDMIDQVFQVAYSFSLAFLHDFLWTFVIISAMSLNNQSCRTSSLKRDQNYREKVENIILSVICIEFIEFIRNSLIALSQVILLIKIAFGNNENILVFACIFNHHTSHIIVTNTKVCYFTCVSVAL